MAIAEAARKNHGVTFPVVGKTSVTAKSGEGTAITVSPREPNRVQSCCSPENCGA
jgi:hypothetical protein